MRASVVGAGLACGCLTIAALVVNAQSGPHRNTEAAKLNNPVERTADSIAAGRKSFQFYCAGCHGPGAKGDGGVYGAFGGGSPTNLTDDEWQRAMSDGEIFAVIRDGIGYVEMTGYRKKMTDQQIWEVVNFIRSVAEKPRTPSAGFRSSEGCL